jgi:branched-chain amino acid transport system ATP-binding protein
VSVPKAPEDPSGHAAATTAAPPVTPATGRVLLECAGIGKEYGGLTVLDDITLTLPPRGLFGLHGPTGASKSTLLAMVGGSVPPSLGRVLLDGADVTRLPPQQRFHLGSAGPSRRCT